MPEYINKQAVLNLIDNIEFDSDSATWDNPWGSDKITLEADTLDKLYKAVNAIPAADVEPVVHARWEACKVGPMNAYSCSNCGLVVIERNIPVLKYCHQCGARMDGEDQ